MGKYSFGEYGFEHCSTSTPRGFWRWNVECSRLKNVLEIWWSLGIHSGVATPVGKERSQIAQIAPLGRVRKVVWGSGAEVQKKSLALVRKGFAPVRTRLAPVRETFSVLPHRSPKRPLALALSPDHFGAIWVISLLSVPAGVVSLGAFSKGMKKTIN